MPHKRNKSAPEDRYERDGTFPLDMIHQHLSGSVVLNGDQMHVGSARYKVFARSNVCSDCGLEGQFYARERNIGSKGSYHLNMYGVIEDGREILFTKDHILPRSRGGADHLDNYRTMCEPCNLKKGNLLEGETTAENRQANNRLRAIGLNAINNPRDPNSKKTRKRQIREEMRFCENILAKAKGSPVTDDPGDE